MLVGKWMTKDPVVIEANATLETAKAKMKKGNFRRLPVVEGSRLVGILTDRDLRKALGLPGANQGQRGDDREGGDRDPGDNAGAGDATPAQA